MDIETIQEKMLAAVDEARNSPLSRVFRWSFEIEDLVCYVLLRSRNRSERLFLLRVDFDNFPSRAPSYVFVDRESKRETPEAWPPGARQSDNPPGICVLGTRECHEHYHANQAQYAYNPVEHTFLSTLTEINRLLEKGVGRV